MVDKIKKALNKLSAEQRKEINDLLARIKNGQLENLDLKKLKGWDDIYRVRKGQTRVIYQIDKDGDIILLEIGRRNDNTYRNF